MMPQPSPLSPDPSTGGRLVTHDGRALPLSAVVLRTQARGGIARTVLEQRFRNPHAEPLAVTYLVPLPADGAVSGFSFRIGERRVTGEVDRRAAARERFEQAVVEGRTAALVEQDRSSLFQQEIGNVPPGAEVVAEITIDQPLAWLAEGAWEWRFPTVVAPRYQGGPGRVPDAARISVDVADGALPVRAQLALSIADALAEGGRPESPSHRLTVRAGAGTEEVELGEETGARLDRDVVVRWPVATPRVGATLATARPAEGRQHAGSAYGLVTVVPPGDRASTRPLPRDLIVLLDTSGSMDGEPLDQARRVVGALLGTLGEADQLEMIEFSSAPRRWKRGPVRATARALEEARQWLGRLRAGGGTEMRTGILEALSGLRAEAQRQVVLVTDGLIGFESEVLAEISTGLPAASRLHTVGVGSAVNRSLTGPAARAGRGVEVVMGLGEDPERAARRLCARSAAPLVVELALDGSALSEPAARRLPDLFAGAPALLPVRLRPEGGELVVRGRTAFGAWEERLRVAPCAAGAGEAAIVALFGREAVEDLELARAAGGPAGELDRAIERIGLDFQIATRLTSWVAVSESPTVDPRDPLRRERIPHELPHGMSIEGLGLRAVGPTRTMTWGARPTVPSPMIAQSYAPASPASVEKARKKMSVTRAGTLGRGALDAMARGGAGPGDDFEEAEPTGASMVAPEPPAPPRLRGRIALRKGRTLVVEITLADPLAWELPVEGILEWADGRTLRARIDGSRTTRPGRLEAGQTLRLSLETDAEPGAGAPAGLVLRLADGALVPVELVE